MENKIVRDLTRDDHFVKIVAGFKIIYDQSQYLAYVEAPKKKREIHLEIYVGRVSKIKDRYLLFKCETAHEKERVFELFKKVFSNEACNEIEYIEYPDMDRISIVSSDQLEEKMDNYPNFFTLPKKEDDNEINISLPHLFKKKEPEKQTEVPNTVPPVPIPTTINQGPVTPEVTPAETVQNVVTNREVPVETTPIMNVQNQTSPEINSVKVEPNPNIEIPPVSSTMINTPIQTEPVMPDPNIIKNEIPEIKTPQIKPPITPSNDQPGTNPPITNKHNYKEPKHKIVIILIIMVFVIIIASILVWKFALEPVASKKEQNNNNNNNKDVVITKKLVCTLEEEDKVNKTKEQNTMTFLYNEQTKKIITGKLEGSVQIEDSEMYSQMKPIVEAMGSMFENTDGVKRTITFNDENLSYYVLEERNYGKATEEEKDETWKETYEETNEYYLDLGYTCDGVTRPKEDDDKDDELEGETINLTSTSGKDEINYDNWTVTFKGATLYKASENITRDSLTFTLDIKNNSTEDRTLKGNFKLYDANKKLLLTYPLEEEVSAEESLYSTKEFMIEENIDITSATSYLIELYR